MCGLGGVLVEILRDVAFGSRRSRGRTRWRCSASCAAHGCSTASVARGPVSRAALADLLLTVAEPDGLALRTGEEAIESWI